MQSGSRYLVQSTASIFPFLVKCRVFKWLIRYVGTTYRLPTNTNIQVYNQISCYLTSGIVHCTITVPISTISFSS